MKLGLQGRTMLFASGDNGVAGGNGQCCASPKCAGGVYNDGKSGAFNPSFPSTCPYVTSVGVGNPLAAAISLTQNSTDPLNRQLKSNQVLPSLLQKKPPTSQSSNSGLEEDSATSFQHHHTKPQL